MTGKSAQSRTEERVWEELISRMARSDQAALAEFYDGTRVLVFGIALKILGDRTLAEEATLDTYFQVWRQAIKFDRARGGPLSWLCTLARSRSIDRLRASDRFKRQDSLTPAEPAPEVSGPGPEESLLLSERRILVREAMNQLSPEQREVIEIAYFAGLTHSEIAERLDQPLGTVKTRIRYGMMRLKELLA